MSAGECSVDFRCVIIDSIELICHEIIESIRLSKNGVETLSLQLEHLLKQIETDEFLGRLACRLEFTNLILQVCRSSPTQNEVVKGPRSPKKKLAETLQNRYNFHRSLTGYTPEDWEKLAFDLKHLQKQLQRKDGMKLIIPDKFKDLSSLNHNSFSQKNTDEDLSQNDASIEDKQNYEYYPEDLDIILGEIDFYQALSYIRHLVSSVNIRSFTQKLLEPLFHDFVSKCEFDNEKLDYLACFFEDAEQTKFLPTSKIKEILKGNNIYSLRRFQKIFGDFIHRWHLKNLPTPKFVEINYNANIVKRTDFQLSENKIDNDELPATNTDENSEEDEDTNNHFVDQLKKFREKLNETGGEDPLTDIIGLENKSKTKINHLSSSKTQKKKRKEIQIQFSDSDEEISSTEEAINDRRKEEKEANGPFKRRRKFMQDEKDAIRKGIEMFGIGNWSRIKSEFPVLGTRTNVNIKDCYRTMCKHGEI